MKLKVFSLYVVVRVQTFLFVLQDASAVIQFIDYIKIDMQTVCMITILFSGFRVSSNPISPIIKLRKKNVASSLFW